MLRVLLVLVVVYFVWLIAKRLAAGPIRGRGFKCQTCRSCGRLFDDGVLCRFQGRETFKNETHIRNCPDYEPR